MNAMAALTDKLLIAGLLPSEEERAAHDFADPYSMLLASTMHNDAFVRPQATDAYLSLAKRLHPDDLDRLLLPSKLVRDSKLEVVRAMPRAELLKKLTETDTLPKVVGSLLNSELSKLKKRLVDLEEKRRIDKRGVDDTPEEEIPQLSNRESEKQKDRESKIREILLQDRENIKEDIEKLEYEIKNLRNEIEYHAMINDEDYNEEHDKENLEELENLLNLRIESLEFEKRISNNEMDDGKKITKESLEIEDEGSYSWQMDLLISRVDTFHRGDVVKRLMTTHKRQIPRILLVNDWLTKELLKVENKHVFKPLLERSSVSVLIEHCNKHANDVFQLSVFENQPDIIDIIWKLLKNETFVDGFYNLLLGKKSDTGEWYYQYENRYDYELVLLVKHKLLEVEEEIFKEFCSRNSTRKSTLADEILKLFLNVVTSLAEKNQVAEFSKDILLQLNPNLFFKHVIRQLPIKIQSDLRKLYLTEDESFIIALSFEPSFFGEFLQSFQDDRLYQMALDVFPIGSFKDELLNAELKDFNEVRQVTTNQTVVLSKELRNRTTTYSEYCQPEEIKNEEEVDYEEDEEDSLKKDHKFDKLVQPDTTLFDGFWHKGNPQKALCTLPHSTIIGYDSHLLTLDDTDYCAILGSDQRGTMPGQATIVDKRTGEAVAVLPGVYMMFLEQSRYSSRLVTFRAAYALNDPPHDEDDYGRRRRFGRYGREDEDEEQNKKEMMLKREVVVYSLKNISNLNKDQPVGTLLERENTEYLGVKMAASFKSACLGKNQSFNYLFFDERNKCHGIFDYYYEESKPYQEKTILLDLPKKFTVSPSSEYYLYDWCNRLVIEDKVNKVWTVFKIKIKSTGGNIFSFFFDLFSRSYNRSSDLGMYPEELFTVNFNTFYEDLAKDSQMITCNNKRDAFLMASMKKPLPIALGSQVFDLIKEDKGSFKNEGFELKPLHKAEGEILSMSSFKDYIVLLTRQEEQQLTRVVVLKRQMNGVFVAAEISDAQESLETNGDLILMRANAKAAAQLVALALAPLRKADVVKHDVYFNRCRFSSDKYYFIETTRTLEKFTMEIRSLLEDKELNSIDLTKNEEFNKVSKVNNYVFNSDFSQALIFASSIQPYEGPKKDFDDLVFRVYLKDGSTELTKFPLDAGSKLSVANNHVTLKKADSTLIYYFSEDGNLLPVELGFVITEKKFDFLVDKSAWIYRGANRAVLGHGAYLLDSGPHLNKAKLFKHAYESTVVAVFNETHALVYLPQSSGNKPIRKEFHLPGIVTACTDYSGVVSFLLVRNAEGNWFLHRLLLTDGTHEKVMIDLGRLVDSNVAIQLNGENSLLMLACRGKDGRQIKVFDIRFFSLLYTIDEEVVDFPINAKSFHARFTTEKFVMMSSPRFSKAIMISTFFAKPQNRIEIIKNFRLRLNYYLRASKANRKDKDQGVESVRQFITSLDPMYLVRETGIFLILANMKQEELLECYVKHVTLKRMLMHGRLLQWMFANLKQGRWLRKLVLAQFNEVFYSRDVDLEGFDSTVIDQLITYKYTPKLLKEPDARGIFLRLFRIPVYQFDNSSDGNDGEPAVLEIDDAELDEDNDTCFLFNYQDGLPKKISRLHQMLQQIKSSNLVPFEVLVSAAPVQLSIGNPLCIKLFKLMDQCPSEELNDLLRPLIYYKWNRVFPLAFIYMILHWFNAILCYLFLGFYFKSYGIGSAIIIMSVFFLFYEVLTMRSHIKDYFKSAWNVLDILFFCISIAFVFLCWNFDVRHPGWAVGRMIVVIVMWVRALTWLKIFRPVRYLITMTLQVFKDMVSYLVILAVSVFGLTFIWRLTYYFAADNGNPIPDTDQDEIVPSFFKSLQVVTMIVLGNMPDKDQNDNEYTVGMFIVAVLLGVMLALALTNLLIAIINQTYSNIEEKKKLYDLRDVISLVIDFDSAARSVFSCAYFECHQFLISIQRKKTESPDVKLSLPDWRCGRAKGRGGQTRT